MNVRTVERHVLNSTLLPVCTGPKFVIPSRHYFGTNLIPDAVAAKTAQLQKVLAIPHHVSVTLDIWTDRRMHSFMAITVHIFSGCKANAFLLSFEAFKGSHTGVRIPEEYEKIGQQSFGKVIFYN